LELKLYDEANWIGRKDAKNGMEIPENECIGVRVGNKCESFYKLVKVISLVFYRHEVSLNCILKAKVKLFLCVSNQMPRHEDLEGS
jgi:hypothetical protein